MTDIYDPTRDWDNLATLAWQYALDAERILRDVTRAAVRNDLRDPRGEYVPYTGLDITGLRKSFSMVAADQYGVFSIPFRSGAFFAYLTAFKMIAEDPDYHLCIGQYEPSMALISAKLMLRHIAPMHDYLTHAFTELAVDIPDYLEEFELGFAIMGDAHHPVEDAMPLRLTR